VVAAITLAGRGRFFWGPSWAAARCPARRGSPGGH